VDAFLADRSPQAYEKVVDRLLASPRYGERMAWEWLDAARYADTNGYQGDSTRTMWPWRDWVIHAFNENYPYDQFVTWQLAGDLIPNPTKEQLLATGFNRNHKITQEGGVIDEEYRMEYVTDRTNTFGKAFLALTFECAKCHDHKYDPLKQEEYYWMFAFINNDNEAQRVVYDDSRSKALEDRTHYLNAAILLTEGPVPGLEPQVRSALAQVHPDLAMIDFMTFTAQVDGNFTQNAMLAKLTTLFGLLALVLAAVGLYGVTAYSVERRTGEIGIRMALGADRLNVVKLVLRGAFVQVGIGLAISIPATILAGYAMSTQLFGVKPYAPDVLLATTLLLSAAGLVATLLPARKAATLEPIRALRAE